MKSDIKEQKNSDNLKLKKYINQSNKCYYQLIFYSLILLGIWINAALLFNSNKKLDEIYYNIPYINYDQELKNIKLILNDIKSESLDIYFKLSDIYLKLINIDINTTKPLFQR